MGTIEPYLTSLRIMQRLHNYKIELFTQLPDSSYQQPVRHAYG